jgi:hypothetical protein
MKNPDGKKCFALFSRLIGSKTSKKKRLPDKKKLAKNLYYWPIVVKMEFEKNTFWHIFNKNGPKECKI